MEKLFDATVEQLLEKILSGEATSAELNVARQMLRDNSITATPRHKPLMDLASEVDPDDLDDAPSLRMAR
jgi:hypothetical protein